MEMRKEVGCKKDYEVQMAGPSNWSNTKKKIGSVKGHGKSEIVL